LAYKIGNTNILSNTGISNSSLPQAPIESTRYDRLLDSGVKYIIGDNRIVTANGTSATVQYLNSNEFSTTFSANLSVYFNTSIGVVIGNPMAIGDGLIAIGDPTNSNLATNAGLATVYDYMGNYKFELQPSTNVTANIYFGHSVSINSNLISVCSFESNVGNFNPGTIYVYYANGNLKSKTYRPIDPGLSDFSKKSFTGGLIDGYRILASDLFSRSSNAALSEAGAVYLFATDNTHIFTANQQVDVGQDDRFGLRVSYSEGVLHVSSPFYESQVAPFPLNDGLVTGLSLQGDIVYRHDRGEVTGLGTYLTSGDGYVAAGGSYSRYITILTSQGEFVQEITLPSDALPNGDMYIHKSKLYVQTIDKLYTYTLPQTHSSYYNAIIKNKKRYY
jgi:hypothetical protein